MSNTKDIFEIEVYREHTIKYNAKSDKFTVELLIEDDYREKSRKSLVECRKTIDEYIKSNFEFKPFIILYSSWGSGEAREVKLVGVRKDSGFILEENGKTNSEIYKVKEQLKGKQNYFFKYNEEYLDWIDKKEVVEKRHMAEIGEIKRQEPKLEPLDLSFVNEINGNM